ncbi:uncharacterized protein LOC120352337 [Nilaparvata lugens]|uniref:uncharacterized protein LOC120352337 n=1 Tax=Nilaparvata lugens TaxID=108931 RepID=UPI00193CEE8A|nr:uncharacterized protein LOC120352337 [Nilaparvata lugens]
MCHINAQSLPAHFDEFKLMLSRVNIDVIAISETFLKPSLLSSYFEVPGYTLFRNDRTGKGGGDVAVYIRSQFPAKVVASSPQLYSCSPEFLMVEVTVGSENLLVVVVYRPPKAGRLFILESDLVNVMHRYQHVITLGDFNADQMKDTFESRQVRSLFESMNMTILDSSPTFHTETCHTLLDLVIVSDPDFVLSNGQMSFSMSAHDLIYIIYSLEHNIRYTSNSKGRNLRDIDLDRCFADAVEKPWHDIVHLDDIDDKVNAFNSMVLSIFDQHAPERDFKVQRRPCPWFNREISLLRRERDKARRDHSRTGCSVDFVRYKTLRNQLRSLEEHSEG